jgi:hypothetical protein
VDIHGIFAGRRRLKTSFDADSSACLQLLLREFLEKACLSRIYGFDLEGRID